ncbi:MAG: hypothetical protein ACI4QX_00870, partial [Lachnospiraceae bacterium]
MKRRGIGCGLLLAFFLAACAGQEAANPDTEQPTPTKVMEEAGNKEEITPTKAAEEAGNKEEITPTKAAEEA